MNKIQRIVSVILSKKLTPVCVRKIFFFLCLLISFHSLSQPASLIKITCTIVDSTSKSPLAGASLYIMGTNTMIAGANSDQQGFCSLEAYILPDVPLVISIQMLGYKKRIITLNKVSSIENLGRIMLVPASDKLKGITVKSRRDVVKFNGNVMNFDVNSIPNMKYMTTPQLLQYFPFIEVDEVSNKIKIMGQDLIILINGRPHAFYNSPRSLNNLPPGAIDHIAVKLIATGRYSGKVMNIVLKKNYFLGWNGNAGITASRYSIGGNGHVSYWTNKFGIDAAISYDYTSAPAHGCQKILSDKDKTKIMEKNNTRTKVPGGSFSTSMFYKLDSLNTLDLGWNISPLFSTRIYTKTNINMTDSTMIPDRQYSTKQMLDKAYANNVNINYTHNFRQKGKQFFILTNYRSGHNNSYYELTNSQDLNSPLVRQMNDKRNKNKEGTIEVLFQKNTKGKFKYDVGSKLVKRWYDNYTDQQTWDYTVTDPGNVPKIWISQYDQSVVSVYGDAELRLKKFTAHAGLRVENESDYYTSPPAYHQTYSALIPNLSLTFNANLHNLFILSYTRNVKRPAFNFMTRAITLNSVYLKDSGNAYLKPQYSSSYGLQYYGNFKFGRAGLNLGYDNINNGIEYDYYAVNTGGILTRSSTNVRRIREYTLGIDLDIPINSKFRVSHFSNGALTVENSNTYHHTAWTGYLNDKFFYRINRKQAIILQLNGYTANVTLQGKEGGRLNVGVIYSLYTALSRKKYPAQFSISVMNPWYPEGTPGRSFSNGAGFSYFSRNYAPNGIVGVGLNITFKGKKFRNKPFHQSKMIHNSDIKQSE